MLAKVFFVSKYIEILKIVRACLKSLNFIMSNKCKKAIYSCVFVCTHIYANKESHHLVSLSNCIHISLNFLYCKKMNNLSPFSFPLFVICCFIELVCISENELKLTFFVAIGSCCFHSSSLWILLLDWNFLNLCCNFYTFIVIKFLPLCYRQLLLYYGQY